LKKIVSNASYIWTIAASLYVIYDNHFYDGASGVSVWAAIAILIIGMFGYKRLGAWATEWGMVDNGKGMLIKTFRDRSSLDSISSAHSLGYYGSRNG
jgi:hypothetical protein